MPTGYTDSIKDDTTLEEYALSCARAFVAGGTLVEDDLASETVIFKGHPYYKTQLDASYVELERLKRMTLDEADKEAICDYEETVSYHRKKAEEARDTRIKYERMLSMVKDWKVPSNDHIALKNFMINQLEESIKHDCGTEEFHNETACHLKPDSGKEYLENKIAEIGEKIAYFKGGITTESEKCDKKNKWIRDLKKSFNKGGEDDADSRS